MTDRKTLDQMNSNDLDQLHARLDQAETELRWWAATDSTDAAAGSYAHRAERAETERDQYRQAILDIDAHATPIGLADQGDPDGNPHHYAITVGALHRALGKIGHTAAPCTAEAAIARVRAIEARLWEVDDSRQMHVSAVCHSVANDLRHALDQPAPVPSGRACRYCPDPLCPEDCPECGSPIHDLDAVPSAMPLVDRPFRSLRQAKEQPGA